MNQPENVLESIQRLAQQVISPEDKMYTAVQLTRRFADLPTELRHDQVVRNIDGVLQKIAERQPYKIITAKQLNHLYEELVRLNPETQFKKHFADLLSLDVKASISQAEPKNRDKFYEDTARDLGQVGTIQHDISDTDDAMILSEADDHSQTCSAEIPYYHNPDLIRQGAEIVDTELRILGIAPRIRLKANNRGELVYAAHLDTTIGHQEIKVPIEVREKQALFPTIFIGNSNKTYKLSRAGLEQFEQEIVESEQQAYQAKAAAARHTLFDDTVRQAGEQSIEVDEHDEDTIQPKARLDVPELEAMLENAVMRKQSAFGDELVDQGIEVVRGELSNINCKQVQIHFAGDSNNGLLFKATLQHGPRKYNVTIPVEINGKQALLPSRFASEDQQKDYDFSAKGLNDFIEENQEQATEVRYSGLILNQDYNSLRKTIHKATFDKNYVIAQEALNCIQDKFGQDAHSAALCDYQTWLTEASQDNTKKCTGCPYHMPRTHRASTSIEDRCGLLHTACRLVIKDEETGICHKNTFDWDRLRDDSYKGTITTSQISFT